MKNLKLLLCLLLAILLSVPVFGLEYEDGEEIESEAEPMVLSYSQAVQMALEDVLSIQDLSDQISDMQDQRNDLRRDIRTLEQGGVLEGMVPNHEVSEQLDRVIMQIATMHMQMEQLQDNQAMSMEQLLSGLQPDGDAMNAAGAVQSIIGNTLAMQDMMNALSMLEMQRLTLQSQVTPIQDGNQRSELIRELRNGVTELEHQIEISTITHAQMRLLRELSLRNLIVAVTDATISLESTQASLALTEENFRRTAVQYEFGLISRNALRTVEQNITRINNELTDRQTDLYNAHQSLNHFLGQPLSQETIIEFEHALPEIPEDLNEHIAEILPLFPNIIRFQHDVDRTGAARRAYRGSNRETRNTLQAAYDRAQLELNQAKMDLETSIRRSFNNLETQLRRKENLYRALELAVESVILERSNMLSGRATQFDIDTALLAVFNAELDIQRAYNALWVQAFIFDNPILFS